MGYKIKGKKLAGFTIIETILTLAIAGLIFSMVFLVLPGVFANARDGQRRDDILSTVSKLKSFQANNNRGALPTDRITGGGLTINGNGITFGATSGTTWVDFYKGFFDESYTDPSGSRYNWKIVNCGTTSVGSSCPNSAELANRTFDNNNFTIYFVLGATCSGDTAVATANNRMVSVLYRLESGVYCANT